MQRQKKRFWLWAAVLSMVLTVVFQAHADEGDTSPQPLKPGMWVVKSTPLVSQPLRSLVAAQVETAVPSAALLLQDHLLAIPKAIKGNETGGLDASIVQNGTIGNYMPSPIANFEGVNNVNGVLPPDTQGDIGYDPNNNKKYYVQWVNLSYRIWDVTNPAAPVSLVGPVAGNALWSGTGTLCASHNDGDPLTRFDNLSKRWVMSQFALSFPNDFHQCIAVSQTADPTGLWNLYDFQTSTTNMNDYGKLGVWPDGYYMSFNQFNGNTYDWAGAAVAVFERDKMLAGQPANMIYIDLGAANMNYGGMLPSDLDGTPPPAGSPNYFAEWDDSTSSLGDLQDTIRIWKFHTDWTTLANTTFGLNSSYDPDLKIATANVNPDMCGGARSCIPQPGTTQKLDAISDRLMYRLQYRNFGDRQTLVGNHTVDANGADKAGVHWFELRDSGSGFGMHQQGVYAPDSDNRWMASAAMDVSGDIALGYSVASSATSPSVRFTGRLALDPAGELPQGETTLIAGGGSQTNSAARWGDYSMMAVDPADGCTFWYTQEYMQTTSSANWQTRIGSFRFPSCSAGPTGALSGTVTTGGSTPVAGATVGVSGGISTVTDGSGHYSISLASGTYDVTVSKYGYLPSTVSGVRITPPDTKTQDFSLSVSPSHNISGEVTDATTGWPLYARIDIAGYPGGPVFSNPVTGEYSIALVESSYTFTVTAMSGGYTTLSQPVVVSSAAVRNFGLAVDSAACTAPGYHFDSGTVFLTDGFDTSTAPAFSTGWGVADVNGTAGNWATSVSTVYPSGYAPHSAPNLAYFNSYDTNNDEQTRLYRTSGLDLSGQTAAYVTFWMYHDTGFSTDIDTVQVQVSTDSGSTWNSVGSPIPRYTGATGWASHTVNINSYIGGGMTDVRIGLLATSAYGNDIHIDDVMVAANVTQCLPTASGGLVIGSVRDANTGAVISTATVKDAALNSAVMIDSSADNARPSRMYVIGLSAAGNTTLTATAYLYGNGQATPTVVAWGTVGQDIQLLAGRFTATPTTLSFTVTKDSPTDSKPLSLVNNGGISSNYEVFALPGLYTPNIPTGPFADNTRHLGPKNLNDRDAAKLRVDLTPTGLAPLATGDVSTTIDITGLTIPWGIGFNTDANDFWLSDANSKLDHRFTTLGGNTGNTIDISSWVSAWGADMTYNPYSNTLWQVNVGGDNCIYELDPVTKTSTGSKICPPFGTSERGLAFDPLSNTYYSGSWNDGIINQFAPDGTLLDSASVGLNISGLAINPVTGHLFVMTNAATASDTSKYDVYVLDTKASYANLGGFNLKVGVTNAFADNAQAGLELDCSGNLWAVDKNASKVYVAQSGETGVCNWQAGWLSATPSSGTVGAGSTAPLSAGVNASALSEGVHNGYFRVENSSPYGPLIVPVTLTVMSKLTVTKSGTGAGTVASTPAGISCGVDCTEQYQPNSVVTLNAAPATYSTFTGWSGDPDCSDGIVTMDTSKTCNAVFTITPIRIPDQYSTIQAAYDVMQPNGSIQSQVRTYPENVRFNRTINATLSGGYSPDWTAATGMTTIQGSLAIEKGSAVISNVVIK
jgi:hypothetical protein